MTNINGLVEVLNNDLENQFEIIKRKAKTLHSDIDHLIDKFKIKPTSIKLYDISYRLDYLVKTYAPKVKPESALRTFNQEKFYFELLPLLQKHNLSMKDVGRSSSFHLTSNHAKKTIDLFHTYNFDKQMDRDEVLDTVEMELVGTNWSEVINEIANGNISNPADVYIYMDIPLGLSLSDFVREADDYLDDILTTLDYIYTELVTVHEILVNIKDVNDYITNFKNNQLEIFTEYLKEL